MIRNIFIVTLVGFLTASCTLYGEKLDETKSAEMEGAAEQAEVSISWISDKVCSHKSGEWDLQIEYSNKGSRSEGQDGKLLKNGEMVDHTKIGNELETPLGKLKHYGTERKVQWALTGWNFADRRMVKRSSNIVED